MRYAQNTQVSDSKTRAEIERTLKKYGATHFGYASSDTQAVITFQASNRNIRFVLSLPQLARYTTNYRRIRNPHLHQQQLTRQLWRVLLIAIKAKLELVECGISSIESEFLSNTVLPNGRTVQEYILPAIEQAYQSGTMPTGFLQLQTGKDSSGHIEGEAREIREENQ